MSGVTHMLLGPLKGAVGSIVNLIGITANSEVGSVNIDTTSTSSVQLTGVQGATQIGIPTIFTDAFVQVFVTGVQASTQLSSAFAKTDFIQTISGVGASTQLGVVSASAVTEALVTGVQASAQTNAVTTATSSSVSVTLTGTTGSAQTGSASVIIESGPFALPADSVLVWGASGDPAPAGFTIMDTGANDHLIMGASTIAQANTFTSTAGTLSGSTTSGSAGAHSTPWSPSGTNSAGSGSPSTTEAASAGTHYHSVVIGSPAIPAETLPNGFGIKLITNASEVSEIPQDAVMFSDSIKSGFERKTWGGPNNIYIARKNTVSTNGVVSAVAKTFTMSAVSAGAHQHTSPSTSGPGGIYTGQVSNISAGTHTHPVSTPSLNLYIYQYYKHLLPFIATTDSAVRSGMIVMFKGASVPAGWSFCDGTNSTPDMRSYFLGYNDDLATTDNVVGSRAAKATQAAPPSAGNTSSTYTPSPISATLNTITWPHSHAGSPRNTTNQTTHFHTTKSVPHSHTAPVIPLTVPSSFLPNTFRLAFIRKD